ncbi:hypothetical protein [Actinoplanes sp. G11-F43]
MSDRVGYVRYSLDMQDRTAQRGILLGLAQSFAAATPSTPGGL